MHISASLVAMAWGNISVDGLKLFRCNQQTQLELSVRARMCPSGGMEFESNSSMMVMTDAKNSRWLLLGSLNFDIFKRQVFPDAME